MWDRQAKARLGYKHPKSRVWTDADGNVIREILHEKDWLQRKWELWQRCKGKCEYEGCHKQGVIPAHIIPRGNGNRNDMLSNLKCYCLEHDREMEGQSWRKTRFGEKVA